MKTFEVTGKKDTRSGFGAGLLEAGRNDENVVALCADLVGSLKMQDFIDEFPERFFSLMNFLKDFSKQVLLRQT